MQQYFAKLDDLLSTLSGYKIRFVFNTVFSGGSYTYLLNLATNTPLLVIDAKFAISNYVAGKVIFIYKDEFHEFYDVDILPLIKAKPILINHLIWSPDVCAWIDLITELVNSYQCKLSIMIHDYYMLCPSINLLNYQEKYCDLPNISKCNDCLLMYDQVNNRLEFNKNEVRSTYPLHRNNMLNWRRLWGQLFSLASFIFFPSQDTCDKYVKIYDLQLDKLSIVPHDLNYLAAIKPHNNSIGLPGAYNVFVIGDIGPHKGSHIISELVDLIVIHKLPIYVNILGNYHGDKHFLLKQHGVFSHKNIAELLNNLAIDCFIMPSVCPETFSYALHEMMATKLPVISFALGAQGTFTSNYAHGIVIDEVSSLLMFNKIVELFRDKEQQQLKLMLKDIKVLNKFMSNYYQIAINNNKLVDTEEKLQASISNLETNASNLQSTVDRLQSDNVNLYNELGRVYQSKSWKVTRPLRWFFRLLKI